nr:thiamine phosphate synthase [uncultured Anaeromusa sp.]
MEKSQVDYTLYLVTDRSFLQGRTLADCVEEACRNGATLVQLREKNASSRFFYEEALAVREVTRKLEIPLIINDRLDIALAVGADGLHVGQEDLPLSIARHQLGKEALIGVSVHSVEEAVTAQAGGADYVGIGSLFPTSTKNDVQQLSWADVQAMREVLHIPAVGIGGIAAANLREVRQSGLDGAAVVSAILSAKDIGGTTRELRQIWEQGHTKK